MPFLSMAFLNRAEFLIENGHHKKNTLLAGYIQLRMIGDLHTN